MIVRRCAACAAPAAIAVRRKHVHHEMAVAGLPARSTTTREMFRCQACGARFELRPRGEAVTHIVIAAILLVAVTAMAIAVAIQGGLEAAFLAITAVVFLPFELAFVIMLAVGVRRLRAPARHPIVERAPAPELRFPELDPYEVPRRCASCGEAAALESVTAHRVQGIPAGTVWNYRCASCDHAFVLRSAWHAMLPELIVITVLVLGGATMFDVDPRWRAAAAVIVAIVVAASAYRARAVARRYPAVVPAAIARETATR